MSGVNKISDNIKYSKIEAASSGDNTLKAAVAGKRIAVLSCLVVARGTVNIRFQSASSGTPLTGLINLVANAGFSLPYNQGGWFTTNKDELLNLNLSGAIGVDGCFSYAEFD